MKKFFFIILVALAPCAAFASEMIDEPANWSLEVKGGMFVPDMDNWSATYGDRSTNEFGGTLAYKLIRQIEVGVGGSYTRAAGTGFAPLHNESAGHVVLNFYPLDVFVLFRGVFSENQWLVPYAGGGWSRIYYREEVDNQGVSRGSADGYHARGGLQFLMDVIDQGAANNFYRDFGVHHTYFFMEARYSRAMADTVSSGSVNLGGKSVLGGLLFEF